MNRTARPAATSSRRHPAHARAPGRSKATEELFHRHLAPLQRWARGRLPNWARDLSDTDDLVQDTLLRTFKQLEHFDSRGVGALNAYLRQAVVNRVRDELRRKGRQPESQTLRTSTSAAISHRSRTRLDARRSNTTRRRSSGYDPRSARRSWRVSRWGTATRSWRRCSGNQRRMPRAKRHNGRSSALPKR